jgi:NAD(P)-dependent dehydrogenase (short-subunit alcohol dehydrogenase family)
MKKLAELQRLDGRVAIVTGGAGPLARAYEEVFAECGASVVVVDKLEDKCAERAKEIAEYGGHDTLGLAADLADPKAPADVVKRVVDRFGRIDILVHNAALTGDSGVPGYCVPFDVQSLEAWNAAVQVNLTAGFLLVQSARHALEASGHGSIINVSSIYGNVGPNMNLYEGTPMGNPVAYAATKGGLIAMTKYLSTVLAPKIRVNTVSPGGIERGQHEAFLARYSKLTPMGRMGREEDFKGIMAFLASDASAWVTGQNFLVDGGWTAW